MEVFPTMKGFAGILVASLALATAIPGLGASDPPTDQTATTRETDKKVPKNTLRWTTAGELENFGFDVYRATDKDGPFKLRTVDPIPGAGTTDLTNKYVWVDKKIDPAVTYYYYVESISLSGVREHFTPIIKAPAKQPAKDGATLRH